MKIRILTVIVLLFGIVGGVRGSLEDILAPLPELEIEVEKSAVVAPGQEDLEKAIESELIQEVVPAIEVVAAKSDAPKAELEQAIETVQGPQIEKAVEVLKVEEKRVVEYPINPADLQRAIEDRLVDHFRPSGRLVLVPLRDLPNLSDHGHPFKVIMTSIPPRLARNNQQLRFQIENEEGILGEWDIPFRVNLFSEVWSISAHLRKGDIATPSDFEVKQVDLLFEPDAVPANMETLLRHEYSRDLRPGKALVWKDLVERSLVSKGDIVEVIATKGLLAITSRARAEMDGTEGDLITLRNLDSSKSFSARVVAENKVEVAF